MAFKDYSELADPLVLPIQGKQYTIPAVGLADGVRLTEVIDPESEPTMDNKEFYRLLLGSAYEEMLADNVPGPAMVRAALAALSDFQSGRAVAEMMWETGGDPKALEAWVKTLTNRASKRAAGRAGTTKPRASGSSTTKPRRNSGVAL